MRKCLVVAMFFPVLLLAAGECFSARRVVLVEQATNMGCGCAGVLDPGLDSLYARYGHEAILSIRYNGGWPWTYDVLYQHNPVEIDARVDYYSMTDMPTIIIDGGHTPRVCDAGSMPARFEERFSAPSPLKLSASGWTDADSFYVEVTVVAEQDPQADTLALRVAVVEDSIYCDAPNNKKYHNCTFRSMLPGTAGRPFSIARGETLDFALSVALHPAWDPSRLEAVAFVQNDADRSVLQAATTRPARETWALYYGADRGDMVPHGGSAALPGAFANLGSARDTFDLDFASSLPGDWNAYYDVAGAGYLGDAIALDPDSSCIITVKFDCGSDGGTGEAVLTLSSRRDPSVERALDFFAVSGVCGLLVDDDGGDTLEHFYEQALDSTGVVYGVWDRSAARLDSTDLSLVEFAVWFTGRAAPALDSADRAALGPYLDSGGSLFLTGQDIAYSMCDLTSAHYTPESRAFFETHIHADYQMPNANLYGLEGREGDVISDGLELTIRGGDGADNQDFPDVVDAISPAVVIFDYSDPAKHGGIRFDDGTTRLVYLSFGFEAIDRRPDRVLLMSRVVDWLAPQASVDRTAAGALRVACHPNPAVSFARISLAAESGWESLRIYDVRGRVVRDLGGAEDGMALWDLRDDQGRAVSPGVYFAGITSGEHSASRKIMVVR